MRFIYGKRYEFHLSKSKSRLRYSHSMNPIPSYQQNVLTICIIQLLWSDDLSNGTKRCTNMVVPRDQYRSFRCIMRDLVDPKRFDVGPWQTRFITSRLWLLLSHQIRCAATWLLATVFYNGENALFTGSNFKSYRRPHWSIQSNGAAGRRQIWPK
jgi:hypothetical protein